MVISKLFSKKLFWLYFAVIILLMIIPINTSGSLNHVTVIKVRGDYFFHVLLFLPWAFFGPCMRKNLWLWLLLGLLFAVSTETLQYFIPNRRFNINDMLSNLIGIILGLIVFTFVSIIEKRIRRTS